jgi:hypothetical protein
MSDSCCGGSAKSKPNKVAMTAVPQATEAAAEQPAAKSHESECCADKGECCNDKPAKNETHGCDC